MDVKIQEIVEETEVMDHWFGTILVSGVQLRLSFKAFCKIQDADFFVALSYKQECAAPSQNHGFMHEYCNMVGGYIKNALDQQHIETKLNLPVVARENKSLFLNYGSEKNLITDRWKLMVTDVSIYCMVTIEVIGDLKLSGENLEFVDSGDINFF